jgi:hypothetical protein
MNGLFANIWDEELEEIAPAVAKVEEDEDAEEPKSKKPLPWRSRSSPSGTYVRDPATGEMKNIDA